MDNDLSEIIIHDFIKLLNKLKKEPSKNEYIQIRKDYYLSLHKIIKENNKPLKNYKFIKSKGKSGAKLAIRNKNTIIKLNKLNPKIDFYKKKDGRLCLKVSNSFNELLQTLIIRFPNMFVNIRSNKSIEKMNEVMKNILIINKIYFASIGNTNYLCIEQPFYGVNINNKYYYDMKDILLNNIFPGFHNNYKTNNIYNEFDDFLTNHILKKIHKSLLFYNERFDFVHSDLKLANILIKYKKNTTYNKLKKLDIFIDFEVIIADLDKSRSVIKDITILSIPTNKLKKMLALYFPSHQMFYNCDPKRLKKCNKLIWYDKCVLCISLLNIMASFFEKKEFISLINNHLPLLKKYITKYIIHENILDKFLNIIYGSNTENLELIYLLILKYCSKYMKKM